MSFSRAIAPKTGPGHDELTAAMVGIGMRFAASGAVSPNIEDTLFFASKEGMDRDDLRSLALLVTWFGVHSAWVNADRLTRLVKTRGSARVQAFWSALAGWQFKDRRFARLMALATKERISVPSSASTFLVSGTAKIRALKVRPSALQPTCFETGSKTFFRRRSWHASIALTGIECRWGLAIEQMLGQR
jgi:hypothetical protein